MGRLLGSVPEDGMGREEDHCCLGSSGGVGEVAKLLVLPALMGLTAFSLLSLMPALQPGNSVLSA